MRITHHTERSSAAFTLLELLVVISAIALLAALLLPALSRAKDRARSVQCLNKVRQWTHAFLLYESESEFIPRESSLTNGQVRAENWANVISAGSRTVWYNCLPPLMNERAARGYASDTAIRGEFYESRIFHCPSTKFPPGVRSDLNVYFSLTMNSKLIQPPVSNPEASIRYDSIQRPAETVVFLESRVSVQEPKADSLQWNTELGQPSCFASRFSPRHRGGGNLGFADGHVDWRSGPTVVETRAGRARGFAIFPDGDLIWTPDPLVDPNGPD
jgi:prepilin-type processing-associated H-X9-DG protein